MKSKLKIIVSFLMVMVICFNTSFFVYAADYGGGGATDTNRDLLKAQESLENRERVEQFIKEHFTDAWGFFVYAASQIGCVVTGQYKDAYDSWLTMEDILNSDVGIYVDQNNKADGLYISADLMAQIKALIDDYAKEHEPYYMVNTLTLDDLLSDHVGAKLMYDTAKNLIEDSPSGVIAFGAYYSRPTQMFFADVGHDFTSISPVKMGTNNLFVNFYNNESWNLSTYIGYEVNLNTNGEAIKTAEEFKEKAVSAYQGSNIGQRFRVYPEGDRPGSFPYNCRNSNGWLNLITKEPRRIRVFNTYADFQNYTLGKRSVYYTKDYYSYVPEDLATSIDDLQQTVDDLSGVIDQLLGQITDTMDESEIEDLLKQILDELKNNQGGGGGGGGSGGGDVNVDIDLSSTNTLLSKILAKVTQIFDRMNTAVGDAEQAAFAKIQESLDEIVEQLKKIKRWTAVDTVIDGVDAIADWLDLVRGVLKDAKEGAGSAVAALSSAVGDSVDLMSKKFPFSIPWDVLFLVSVLSAEPQMPYFEIPFNIESSMLGITIDYTMELDFSQFQWLSDLSRLILSMTYAVGLMKTTFGVTSVGKEE